MTAKRYVYMEIKGLETAYPYCCSPTCTLQPAATTIQRPRSRLTTSAPSRTAPVPRPADEAGYQSTLSAHEVSLLLNVVPVVTMASNGATVSAAVQEQPAGPSAAIPNGGYGWTVVFCCAFITFWYNSIIGCWGVLQAALLDSTLSAVESKDY
ncbi:hypothetical protein E8E12_000534 [Didymella heteroderae]|uniref:Uncharacterized protein n=1 Tax=Didymella heteroderae TaxID=1769908 RepID=A0A9P5BUZ0_9PLEO|nr:hypothetical protein E8E12_000534 [Didymella heteroderae]